MYSGKILDESYRSSNLLNSSAYVFSSNILEMHQKTGRAWENSREGKLTREDLDDVRKLSKKRKKKKKGLKRSE